MSSLIDSLRDFFSGQSGSDPFSVPDRLKQDIDFNLAQDESFLMSLKCLSAKYKAQRLIDSNTFFSPYLILTSNRVIIARNSSTLNIFREIELRNIVDHSFDIGRNRTSITLKLYNSSAVITFHQSSEESTRMIKERFEKAVEAVSGSAEKKVYCRFCGEKIPSDSNFCQDCGSRL